MREKKVLPFLLLAGCCIMAAVLWWSNSSQARISTASITKHPSSLDSPVDRLNTKSRAVKNKEPGSIEELADVIIDDFIPVSLTPGARAEVKQRLVHAETDYQKGRKGVPESFVARAVNQLAEEFGAPEYVRTSPSQVRYLRTSLLGTFPDLLAQKSHAREPVKVGSSINPLLSPAEATFLTALMLQQKMINEDFQVEPKGVIIFIKRTCNPGMHSALGAAWMRRLLVRG